MEIRFRIHWIAVRCLSQLEGPGMVGLHHEIADRGQGNPVAIGWDSEGGCLSHIPLDAVLAAENGASGIIISNHGGRQLDTSPSTIECLPMIVAALRQKGYTIPVLIDGGIRRGSSVLKALALGASAVMVGRPILWGLAHSGQEGVRSVLQILKDELKLAMSLSGCTSIANCTKVTIVTNSAL